MYKLTIISHWSSPFGNWMILHLLSHGSMSVSHSLRTTNCDSILPRAFILTNKLSYGNPMGWKWDQRPIIFKLNVFRHTFNQSFLSGIAFAWLWLMSVAGYACRSSMLSSIVSCSKVKINWEDFFNWIFNLQSEGSEQIPELRTLWQLECMILTLIEKHPLALPLLLRSEWKSEK